MAQINVVTTGAPNVAWCHACRRDADFCWYALLAVCFSCITNGGFLGFILLFLLCSSGINHIFVSIHLWPSMTIFLSLNTCTLPLLNTTVQSAPHSNGTDISVRSNSLNPCPVCACIGSSGYSCSCQVVIESILFVLSTPTLVSSCGSSLMKTY